MAIIINNLFGRIDEPQEQVLEKVRKALRLSKEQEDEIYIAKISLDARRRSQVRFVYTVHASLCSKQAEHRLVQQAPLEHMRLVEEEPFTFPPKNQKKKASIVIGGLGPAGLFAGLVLAQNGYEPVILERGTPLEQRVRDVEAFWQTGALKPESNVQFGEGGAGAFSDGKLTTRIGDFRCRYVLESLVKFGAPSSILQSAKPHIGTDRLRKVVIELRKGILQAGGTILWNTALTGIITKNGAVTGIKTSGGVLPASAVILAVGHSARDTFQMLYHDGVPMQAKPFSVGMRMEHPQEVIDRGLYGDLAGHPALPVGEYQLSYRKNGRGVYTFCMCPGGVVVPAASEEGGVVTNGMSYHARNGKNANAALVVGVTPEDFGAHPLDGIAFQRKLEQAAFSMGGGDFRAPGCYAGTLLGQAVSGAKVTPTYARGIRECDAASLFSPHIRSFLQEGLMRFGEKLPGFSMTGAFLTGVETRTSSPVRIPRGEDGQSIQIKGLYPCGEGAGYAGGIMSAAVDGLRCAQAAAEHC